MRRDANGRGALEEELRRANPVRVEDMPGPDSPQARALFQRMVDLPVPEPSAERRRRARRPWLLIPAALLITAAAWVIYGVVDDPTGYECFRTPAGDDRLFVGADGRDPAIVCAEVWPAEWGPVPDPVARCVTEFGLVAVVPGEAGETGLCVELGLAPLDIEFEPATDPAVALSEAIVTRVLDAGCLSEEQLTAIGQEEIDRLGLTGTWQVRTLRPFSAETPCAIPSIDAAATSVLIVPTVPFDAVPNGP